MRVAETDGHACEMAAYDTTCGSDRACDETGVDGVECYEGNTDEDFTGAGGRAADIVHCDGFVFGVDNEGFHFGDREKKREWYYRLSRNRRVERVFSIRKNIRSSILNSRHVQASSTTYPSSSYLNSVRAHLLNIS